MTDVTELEHLAKALSEAAHQPGANAPYGSPKVGYGRPKPPSERAVQLVEELTKQAVGA